MKVFKQGGPRPQETEAMTTDALKIVFEMTAEANARAGGTGTNDEIREMIDCSRCKFRVRSNHSESFVADMWANGYRVVSARAAE